MLYIIADDLTGATDTGVQFSTKNYKTDVIIYSKNIKDINTTDINSDILVLDSETREVKKATAQKRIKKLLDTINLNKDDILYKKVDSTLRGNIGIELDEIMNKFDYNLCIFSPSFIDNKRITKNGNLIVEDKYLGETEYYEGTLKPQNASYIPNIIKEQSISNLYVLDLNTLINNNYNLSKIINNIDIPDKTILVIDSTEENHLKEIIKNSKRINKKIFYAGSAGLANYLNLIYTNKLFKKDFKINKANKLLIVAASRRKIIDNQLDIVKKVYDVIDFKIEVDQIIDNYNIKLKEDFKKIKNLIDSNNKIIIRPDPIFKKEKEIRKLLETNKINFRKLQVIIKNYISKLVKMILEYNNDFDLFITGGDTAAGVCNELKVDNLSIIDELLPGIPISKAYTNKYGNLNIITKAGGFGDENSICKVIEKISN